MTQVRELTVAQKDQVASSQPIIDGFDGLMARINALGALPFLPSFFIFLLFLAIETSPIIAKILAILGVIKYRCRRTATIINAIHICAIVLKTLKYALYFLL